MMIITHLQPNHQQSKKGMVTWYLLGVLGSANENREDVTMTNALAS
jgi:hypothetical protein